MTHWHPSTEPPPLESAAVHVWRWPLKLPAAVLEHLWEVINPDERQRAERFVFPEHRNSFVAGRGLLRTILGLYLNQPPQELVFAYGPHGKPSLVEKGQPASLHFNLAHSHELALLALARGRQVGVDVERIRPDCPGETIAQQFFAPAEIAVLRAAADNLRCQTFFTLWTRKEALIKATGKGLAIPLAAFEVLPLEPRCDIPMTIADAEGETRSWMLRDLAPGDGYRGALAVEGAGWQLWCGEFSIADYGLRSAE